MRIKVAMAGAAIHRHFYRVHRRAVAGHAAHVVVHSAQGKVRIAPMIEGGGAPICVAVAGFTTGAKIAAMRIVLAVAGNARLECFGGMVISMALRAFGLLMFKAQRKARFRVIEMRVFPARFVVTVGALKPQSSLVFVIFTVTALALQRCAAVFGARAVAFGASNRRVLTESWLRLILFFASRPLCSVWHVRQSRSLILPWNPRRPFTSAATGLWQSRHRPACAGRLKRTWQFLHSVSSLACPAITLPGINTVSRFCARARLPCIDRVTQIKYAINASGCLVSVNSHDMNNSTEYKKVNKRYVQHMPQRKQAFIS